MFRQDVQVSNGKDTLSLNANLDMSGEWLERRMKQSARERRWKSSNIGLSTKE